MKKIDTNGHEQFTLSIGYYHLLALDNHDNLIVFGENKLSKFDLTGNIIWKKPVTGGGSVSAVAATDDIVISGENAEQIQIGDKNFEVHDFYIAQLSPDGDLNWFFTPQAGNSRNRAGFIIWRSTKVGMYMLWGESIIVGVKLFLMVHILWIIIMCSLRNLESTG